MFLLVLYDIKVTRASVAKNKSLNSSGGHPVHSLKIVPQLFLLQECASYNIYIIKQVLVTTLSENVS